MKEGPSFTSRGGPESRAECLILTCLNQQVLTEDGGGAEYKEPAFPNRNLLKVASDLRGCVRVRRAKQSELGGCRPERGSASLQPCLL